MRLKPAGIVLLVCLVLLVLIGAYLVFVPMLRSAIQRPTTAIALETATSVPQPTVVQTKPTAIQAATATPATPKATAQQATATPAPTTAPQVTVTSASTWPVVEIGIIAPFAPYAIAPGATFFGNEWEVTIRVVDLSGTGEEHQCLWLREEEDKPGPEVKGRILFTTLNSARLCPGVTIPMLIGQSRGTDAIVCRPEIQELNEIFRQPSTGAGYGSVSEYYLKSLAWALGETVTKFIPQDDAGPALDAWTADPKIKCAALWEPHVSKALENVPGSWKALSSESWTGLWDVMVIQQTQEFNEPLARAMGACQSFVKLQTEEFDRSWETLASYPEAAHVGYGDDIEAFKADLGGEAMATFADNVSAFLVERKMLLTRINETESVVTTFPVIGKDGKIRNLPPASAESYLDDRYVKRLREERGSSLETKARPLNPNISLAVSASLGQTVGKASERVIAQVPDVYIEYVGNSSDFVNEQEARRIIEQIYLPSLRLFDDTILELRGGYAMPANCSGCTDEGGRRLAIDRVDKVYKYLTELYGVPVDRVRLAKNPDGSYNIREPQYRGTSDQKLMASDRRVEGKLLRVVGQ